MKLLIKIGFFCLVIHYVNAQNQEGQLIDTTIYAPSLHNNIFDDITQQPVAIYLPSYASSDNRYPVVYFLPGFSTEYSDFLDGTFQGFMLRNSMDNLISSGTIKEMIVVVPNGLTFLFGSYYVNSSVRGNWEDYIVHDLVDYIDNIIIEALLTLIQEVSREIQWEDSAH
jgi:hypothetical protein